MKNGFKSILRREKCALYKYVTSGCRGDGLKTWKEQKERTAGVPPPDFCAACPVTTSGENHPRSASETCIAGLFLINHRSAKWSRKIEKMTSALAVGSAGRC